jgi:hypothetical protein
LLLIVGLIIGPVGWALLGRAEAFPGPVEKIDATVLDSRVASCDWDVPSVRVRFDLDGDERVEELSENDCALLRTKGETISVYVLAEWPQYVGSCRHCLPVDADDAPEMYSYELGGLGLTVLGFVAIVTGLVLSAIAAVRTRRPERRNAPN